MSVFIRILAIFAIAFFAITTSGCSSESANNPSGEGEGENIPITVKGRVMDGPFYEGAVVKVYMINKTTLRQTGESFTAYTDRFGSFAVDATIGYALISVRGYHHLEIIGKKSQGEMEIACFAQFEASGQNVYCSLFGQSIRPRLQKLVQEDGQKFKESIDQAELEFRAAMRQVGIIHPDEASALHADEVDLMSGDSPDTQWLLALSASYIQVCLNQGLGEAEMPGCLQTFSNSVANDFVDGELRDDIIIKLQSAVRVMDPTVVTQSSRAYIETVGLVDENGSPVVAANADAALDTDGDGIANPLDDDIDGDGVLNAEDCNAKKVDLWNVIAAGRYTLYGLGSDGSLHSEGQPDYGNTEGQMYDGTDTDWSEVSSGDEGLFACAIKSAGTLWCWGRGGQGETNFGYVPCNSSEIPAPCQVGADADWAHVYVGGNYACSLKSSGALWCWGKSATDGSVVVPAQVAGEFVAASVGGNWTCAIATAGTLWCWFAGQEASPVQVGTDADWIGGDSGGYDTSDFFCDWPPPPGERSNCGDFAPFAGWFCGLRSGADGFHCVEARSDAFAFTDPAQISTDIQFTEISVSGVEADHRHVCGITTDNRILCWNGTLDSEPKEVLTTCGKWVELATSRSYQCGLKTDRTVWCWNPVTMVETITKLSTAQAVPFTP
ncbi:thrombospondin type 3 repeat-containing protein [Patescibacteria group bacterium]|nr:thrombospondin type 3 repeat-containing protein [Patescibacteria group bacterium]